MSLWMQIVSMNPYSFMRLGITGTSVDVFIGDLNVATEIPGPDGGNFGRQATCVGRGGVQTVTKL